MHTYSLTILTTNENLDNTECIDTMFQIEES